MISVDMAPGSSGEISVSGGDMVKVLEDWEATN
jgi:hypothetical protein